MNKKFLQFDGRSAVFAPYSSKCAGCAHFDLTDYVCPAFPDGVPDHFLDGSEVHLVVAPDQTGDLVFTEP